MTLSAPDAVGSRHDGKGCGYPKVKLQLVMTYFERCANHIHAMCAIEKLKNEGYMAECW
jgi:hypothetical protein